MTRPTWDSLRVPPHHSIYSADLTEAEWKAAAGPVLRDEGMARASAAEDPEWREAALKVIEAWPKGWRIEADDVRRRCGDPFRANSMGSIFRTAALRGWIEPDGYVKARRRERHASRMLRWVRNG